MKNMIGVFVLALAWVPISALAQNSPTPAIGPPLKTTYVRLTNNSNAILVERVTPDPAKSSIAVVVTHPGHSDNFNYFTGWEFARRGYRAMMVNYYGPEVSFYEFNQPLAAAIKALRAIPGVEKVVLMGNSTGGAVLTSYEDIAENGPKACQEQNRILKCDGKGLDNLPRADGVMLIDSNSGALEKTIALNPAANSSDPRYRDPALDPFNPKNGFDPTTKLANYSPEFLNKFFAAQGARANKIIDQVEARLTKIEKGEGQYKDDEPFVVFGSACCLNGARPDLADHDLLAKTHAPHMLLKADGTKPVEIIPALIPARATPEDEDSLAETTQNVTVREYLSFQGLRVMPDYRLTADRILGVEWRTTPDSLQGNILGIKVPTLIMAGTCEPHVVMLETAYDLSPARDKEMVGVEGADHGMMPCKPEYGDTFKRTFDYADSWLSKPGRF